MVVPTILSFFLWIKILEFNEEMKNPKKLIIILS